MPTADWHDHFFARYAFHKKGYSARTGKNFAKVLDRVPVTA